MKVSSFLLAAVAVTLNIFFAAADPEPQWTIGQQITCGTYNAEVIGVLPTSPGPTRAPADIITEFRQAWQSRTSPGSVFAGNNWHLGYLASEDERWWELSQEEFDCFIGRAVDQFQNNGVWTTFMVFADPPETDGARRDLAMVQWRTEEQVEEMRK